MMRDAVALVAGHGLADAAKLPLVGDVRGQDGVIGIEHDHRLDLVFEKRDQGLHHGRAGGWLDAGDRWRWHAGSLLCSHTVAGLPIGHFPAPEANGIRYLKIPLNAL